MEREDPASQATATPISLTQSALNLFNELRHTGQLCDVVLRVEGASFPCHRTIMATCSPYFRSLFTNEQCPTESREIFIPCLTADSMAGFIEYAYTHDCKVTADNVEELLPAADQFHVHGLVKVCCNFLTSQLCPENVIGIYKFAKAYHCHNLEKKAFRYLMKNFSKIYDVSNEFLQLSVDEVCAFLEPDELNVKNEEVVFESVIRWIDYDAEKRMSSIPKLFRCVRLGLLATPYFVQKVKDHPYIRDNEGCKPMIIDTLKFLYELDMEEEKDVDLNNPIARPRMPHEVMFAIGGWSGGSPTDIVETYDTRADRWIDTDSLDTGPRAYHGTVCIDRLIYIIGGFDGMEYFNSVRRFDPATKLWSEAAPMYAKRCYVSTTVLDGLIYAMGGFDGQNRQNTAERYFPKKNQWSLIPPMHFQRSDASATGFKGKVYICGGFNGQECLSSAETYDPAAKQWTIIAPMRKRRSGVGIIAYRDAIFALGGFDGVTRMDTGEKFNPVTNTWQNIPNMYNPRSNFAIEVIDDMIFVVGGFNGVTTIYHVECFDATADEWLDATDMNLYRSALSACVVSGLPNIEDYVPKDRDKIDPEFVKERSRGVVSAEA